MIKNKALDFLTWYKQETDPELSNLIDKRAKEAKMLGSVLGKIWQNFSDILRRGKRFRGGLVVLGYKLSGGKNIREILKTSLFVEIIHAGILVQDDVMDRDEKRRGLIALHKQAESMGEKMGIGIDSFHYGESVAISMGDGAFFMGLSTLLESKFKMEKILRAEKIACDYLARTAYGQILDLTVTEISNVEDEDVLQMMRLKTAEYTAVMPLLIGAVLAGETNKKRLQLIKEFGLCLGWAFQIQDDVLGMFGDEKITGKPVGSDLKEAKNTLLLLEAKRKTNRHDWKELQLILGKRRILKNDVLKVQKIIKESGAYSSVIKKAKAQVLQGKKQIKVLTEDRDLRIILNDFLQLMVDRVS